MKYSVLKVKGKDAAVFLHRQSSNDIEHLKDGEGNYVAFLNPQGKIRNLVYLIKCADSFDLVVDTNKLNYLEEDLKRYAIIEELEFTKSKIQIPSGIELEEFTENDTLIKLNLIPKYVSFSKGCFPGQEVLAKFKNLGQKKRKERANKYLDEALDIFNSAPNEGSEARSAQEKSIELLYKAINDDPECEDAYESLGVILGRQGRYQEAIDVMQKLEKINPASIMAQTNLSIFFMKLGDKDKAEEHKAKGTVLQFDQALKK